MISRLEILDQSNGTGGYVSQVVGGIFYQYVTIFFDSIDFTNPIDFIINVYAEPLTPNDFFAGDLTNSSVLIHHGGVISETSGRYNFYWNDPSYDITRIEAHDQSFGAGGEIYWVIGGVNYTFVEIEFISVYSNSKIDFLIDIYGESNSNHDIILI